jgi:hypothetical protein
LRLRDCPIKTLSRYHPLMSPVSFILDIWHNNEINNLHL